MIDSRSLWELHPVLQRGATELTLRMKALGYPLSICSTYRDFECQNAIYAKGRTVGGKIVTNAKAGESVHNYRMAFDIFKNIKGQEWSDKTFFQTAGNIWSEMGGVWGGSWTNFIDMPHFEFTDGITLKDLQKGKLMSKNAKMKWETDKLAEIKHLLKLCDQNNIKYVKEYWDKVINNEETASPIWLSELKEKTRGVLK